MIINTCFKMTALFYHQGYLIFSTTFSSFLTLLKLCFSIFRTKKCNIMALIIWNANYNDLSETKIFLSKKFSSKRFIELLLDLSVLYDFLLIDFSKDFRSELSTKLSKMFLYVLEITTILKYLSPLLTIRLIIWILKIVTIRF